LKRESKAIPVLSRRTKKAIIGFLIIAVALLVWFDRSYLSNNWPQNQTNTQKNTADFAKYHGNTFTVINVVDGDTLDIDADDEQSDSTRIRLWGIDTPETKNPNTPKMYFGAEASSFTTKLILGKQVHIYLDEQNNTRGKYGRLLAYVQLPDGRFLNEILLNEGFAYADLRFKHSLYYKYQQLESAARSQGKGLWGHVRHEQLPAWLQREKPQLLLKK